MEISLRKNDLIEPELSYKILGCAFDVFNTIGPGHLEKVYQKALAEAFRVCGLKFEEQVYLKVAYNHVTVSRGYCDFLVEDKIIVEIKQGLHFSITDFKQTRAYLEPNQLALGILLRFAKESVLHKRVINFQMLQL